MLVLVLVLVVADGNANISTSISIRPVKRSLADMSLTVIAETFLNHGWRVAAELSKDPVTRFRVLSQRSCHSL